MYLNVKKFTNNDKNKNACTNIHINQNLKNLSYIQKQMKYMQLKKKANN